MSSTSQLLNPNNVHGGPFTTDPTGAVANSGNRLYGHVGGSAAALNREGLYSVTGGDGVPSSVKTQMGGSSCGRAMAGGSTCGANRMMAGGGRRRKSSGKRSRKNKRSRSSKKYARKRSLRYRMKHRRSRRHSRSRKAQAGGYQQYMSNVPFSLGFRTPGFGLTSGTSALANPVPFMPYNSHD